LAEIYAITCFANFDGVVSADSISGIVDILNSLTAECEEKKCDADPGENSGLRTVASNGILTRYAHGILLVTSRAHGV